MWLPTPIYECIPYVYLITGLLFIFGTVYVGLDAAFGLIYLSIGIVCLLAGVIIYLKRQHNRNPQSGAEPSGSA